LKAVESALELQMRRIRTALVERRGSAHSDVLPPAPGISSVDRAASLATVNAHWGIASRLPIVGPIVVLIRRAIRIGLRWYINPIVDQQNVFNEAAVAALYDLRLENERLRDEVAALRRGERSAES
jgi:hypothetical protein